VSQFQQEKITMYGTIARLSIKQGKEAEWLAIGNEMETNSPPGSVIDIIFRSDSDPQVYYLAVVFESKEVYIANANSPEQHAQYLRYRALLEEEPEWHDGDVVAMHQAAMQKS
jgi:antibiotic biosynthesis monooxygenase (ABM) superfamily enzyme